MISVAMRKISAHGENTLFKDKNKSLPHLSKLRLNYGSKVSKELKYQEKLITQNVNAALILSPIIFLKPDDDYLNLQ